MKKITPYLWFDNMQAEVAMNFYVSLFKNSRVNSISRGPDGNVFHVLFELDGQEFMGLNAGEMFKFNEAISMYVNCEDQAETDYYWEALTANGGEEGSCGWCKDKYGLSWQVVPTEYFELIHSDDPKVREKAMKNTLTQKKLILSELK